MGWHLNADIGRPPYFLVRFFIQIGFHQTMLRDVLWTIIVCAAIPPNFVGCGTRLPAISPGCAAVRFDAVFAPSCGQRLDLRLPGVDLGDLCNHASPNG